MLMVLGFSALGRQFPRTMRVFAQVQVVVFLVAVGIGLDRAYHGANFNTPAIVAIYLFCTLTLTALALRRPHSAAGADYPVIDPTRPGVDFHISPGAPGPLPPDDRLPRKGSARELQAVLKQLAEDRIEDERRTRGGKP